MLLSSFPRVRALGPSGPFGPNGGARWVEDGPAAQIFTLEAYHDVLVERQLPDAGTVTAWLREHGARHVLWAHGHSLKRGRVDFAWSVRIAALDGTSAARTDTLVFDDQIGPPETHGDLARVSKRDAVVRVGVRLQDHGGRRRKGDAADACVTLAVGRLAATAVVSAPDRARAESAAACLAGLVATDMEEAMAPSGGASWHRVS